MFSDSDETIKEKAALILGHIGKAAIPALLPILSDDNATNRCLAAYALGEIGGDARPLVSNLEPLLVDTAVFVKLAAADAIFKVGGNPDIFIPVLLHLLLYADDDSKAMASDVLSKLKDCGSSAVPILLASLSTCTNQNDRYLISGALSGIDPRTAEKVRCEVSLPPEE